MNAITVEVIGYQDSECSPFPCDDDRTCELSACKPSNKLVNATEALRNKIKEEFSQEIQVTLTLLDSGVPEYIRKIYEEKHPAIPMILINGELLPVGRISWSHIRDAVRRVIES